MPKVIHRTNLKTYDADRLSRLQTVGDGDTPIEDNLRILTINAKDEQKSIFSSTAKNVKFIPLSVQEIKLVSTCSALEQLIVKQVHDKSFEAALRNISYTSSEFHVDQQGLLVQKSRSDEPI